MSVSFSACDHLNATQVMRSDGQRHTRYAEVEIPETWQFNWSNRNARLVLALLGLEDPYLSGEASVAECRRALMLARSRDASAYTRGEEVEYGAPRPNEDGTIELKPVRMLSYGLDSEGVRHRMEAFAQFVEVAAKLGATHIRWG